MWEGMLRIVPSLVLLILVLIIGYFIAKAGGWVFSKALIKLGFDKRMEKVGVAGQLKSIGIDSASKFLGIFVFWFIFVIVIQIAISMMGVPSITNILGPIVLFIPRILIAAIILLIGLYVANILAKKVLNQLEKTQLGQQLHDIDKKTKSSGFSMIRLISIFIKIFILLFFLQVALEIVNIGLLSEFITPVLLLMPLILVAFFIVLVGLVVTEVIKKALLKLIKEFEIQKLIRPVEKTIGKKGVVINIFLFVVKLIIMLIFIQLAIGVLNSTGAFDQLAQLINEIILWMPNVIAALVIILIGFWLAGWVAEKIRAYGKQVGLPFPETVATAGKFIIICLAGVMAIAQIGFAVEILYIVTAIALGAIAIGLGLGFALGSKELFANVGGYFQNNKVLRKGQVVTVDDKYSGTIKDIDHYTTTILMDNGQKVILPNSQLVKSVIVELPQAKPVK
jgi:small-conductance mechanosensitive channel